MENDIPPDGTRHFCDTPEYSAELPCYDRNDTPESFCVNNPQYGFLRQQNLFVMMKVVYQVQMQNELTQITNSNDCPENYVRYNEHCGHYRVLR